MQNGSKETWMPWQPQFNLQMRNNHLLVVKSLTGLVIHLVMQRGQIGMSGLPSLPSTNMEQLASKNRLRIHKKELIQASKRVTIPVLMMGGNPAFLLGKPLWFLEEKNRPTDVIFLPG